MKTRKQRKRDKLSRVQPLTGPVFTGELGESLHLNNSYNNDDDDDINNDHNRLDLWSVYVYQIKFSRLLTIWC